MDEKLEVYEKKKIQKEKKRKVSFIIDVEDQNINYKNEILDIAEYACYYYSRHILVIKCIMHLNHKWTFFMFL